MDAKKLPCGSLLISFYFSKLTEINRQLVTAMVSLVYVELGLDKILYRRKERPQRLKPLSSPEHFAARLKPCP
jgi:hypothetical protein